MNEKLKAVAAFILAWLSTPSSKVGIVAIMTGASGKWLSPVQVEALYWTLMMGAGVVLVIWPGQKK